MKLFNLKSCANIKAKSPWTALVVVGAMLTQLALPLGALAADPAFNTYTPYTHTWSGAQDYYLLDVKNDTQGTSWGFPVSANAGDLLTFYFYYHNSSVGSTAYNTTMQIVAPTGASAYQTVTANLWADNATNATRLSPMTQSVGVNLGTSQTLQYVSGSARWYPNRADWQSAGSTAFPNGQSESQLFGSGINIGSVQGCWEYSGAIVFQMRAGSTTATQDLSITKLVRNQTTGQSIYVNSTNAYANDRLSFQLQLANTGNSTLGNVIVRDQLPYQLTYASGSTLVDGSYVADGIASGGINVGSIAAGATRTVTFDATVGSSYSSQTVTNLAYARADSVSERSSSASVYLATTSSPSPSPSGNLTISKTVRNYNAYSSSAFSESVNATNGDRVTFQIQVTNNTNFTVSNVNLRDNLPSGMSYIPGTARLDSGYVADSIISSGGVNIGSMYPGVARTLIFDASISVGTGYNQTLVNYAYARADSITEVNDSATVYASQSTTYNNVTPYYYSNLNLTKSVRNLTTNQTGLANSTTASTGDHLLFTIELVTPVGGNTYNQVNNIRVWDILPAGLTYVTGTARMDGGLVNDSLVTGNGISVGTMFSNQTKTITFEATVNSYGANQTMTNYAYASADGLAQQNAFAQVTTGTPAAAPVTPTVKGAAVHAVTGSNDLARNIGLAMLMSIIGIIMLYVIVEYAEFWRDLRFKFILWQIRTKERLS